MSGRGLGVVCKENVGGGWGERVKKVVEEVRKGGEDR